MLPGNNPAVFAVCSRKQRGRREARRCCGHARLCPAGGGGDPVAECMLVAEVEGVQKRQILLNGEYVDDVLMGKWLD